MCSSFCVVQEQKRSIWIWIWPRAAMHWIPGRRSSWLVCNHLQGLERMAHTHINTHTLSHTHTHTQTHTHTHTHTHTCAHTHARLHRGRGCQPHRCARLGAHGQLKKATCWEHNHPRHRTTTNCQAPCLWGAWLGAVPSTSGRGEGGVVCGSRKEEMYF